MTTRVQCHACRTTYAMPEGAKPADVSAWATMHIEVCTEATGVTLLGIDDDDGHERVDVSHDNVRRAAKRAAERREADIAAIDTLDAQLERWQLATQTSPHPAFDTTMVDDCRRAVIRTIVELRSHLRAMRRRALQLGHIVDVDRRSE